MNPREYSKAFISIFYFLISCLLTTIGLLIAMTAYSAAITSATAFYLYPIETSVFLGVSGTVATIDYTLGKNGSFISMFSLGSLMAYICFNFAKLMIEAVTLASFLTGVSPSFIYAPIAGVALMSYFVTLNPVKRLFSPESKPTTSKNLHAQNPQAPHRDEDGDHPPAGAVPVRP